MNTNNNCNTSNSRSSLRACSLETLARRLDDSDTSEEAERLVGKIVRTGDPDAIELLVEWLGVPGVVGGAVVDGLIEFGQLAETSVRRALDALDEGTIRNAHRVLAALGDRTSRRAVKAHCWADLEEQGWGNVKRVSEG